MKRDARFLRRGTRALLSRRGEGEDIKRDISKMRRLVRFDTVSRWDWTTFFSGVVGPAESHKCKPKF